MNRLFTSMIMAVVCLFFLMFTGTGCAKRFYGKPPGTFIGSCSGIMELEDGDTSRFTFSLYKESDNDLKFYLNLPGKRIWYAQVEDISIDDEVVTVELKNRRKIYEGTIAGGSLKFKGEWGDYKGSLILDLK